MTLYSGNKQLLVMRYPILNLFYLGYFILKSDYRDLLASLKCCINIGYHPIQLTLDMILSTLRYGSSFSEYFNYQFFRLSNNERNQYATMGIMYRFHQKANDKKKSRLVDNKINFAQYFSCFSNANYNFKSRDYISFCQYIETMAGNKVVIKDPDSTEGRGVTVVTVKRTSEGISLSDEKIDSFFRRYTKNNNVIYLEPFVQQHRLLASLAPSALNTVRLVTYLRHQSQPDILGATLRISVSGTVDNFSAGNLAAEIDIETGIVITGGIRKRSSCDYCHIYHPVTGMPIKGFKLPFWSETLQLIKDAALIIPEVRSVGWDVAITDAGPLLIEGNSKWAAGNWQIPSGKGKKHLLY